MAAGTKGPAGLTAGVGALMVLCCLAGPAVVGAVAGSAIGGWLGIVVALVVAVAVAGALTWRARKRGQVC